MRSILSLLFSLFLMIAIGQTSDSVVVNGPAKYKKEVVQIFEKYGRISDSLTQIGVTQNFKSDTTKINGYNSGVVGFYIDQELKEMESILTRFISIKRVIAVYKQTDGIKKENIFIVSFEGDGKKQKNGEVKWVVRID